MKTGILLWLALLTLFGRPAVAATVNGPLSLSAMVGTLDDTGSAQGITLGLLISLNISHLDDWSGTGRATYSIDSGTQIHTGTLNFSNGQRSQLISIPVTYSRATSGQPFVVNLSNKVNLSGGDTLSVNPNFFPRVWWITGATVAEGNTGTTQVSFTFSFHPTIAITEPITFTYVSSGGTATAGEDYTPVFGTATIPAGSVSTTISVTVKGDRVVEPDETIGIEFSEISVPMMPGMNTPATILNDDSANTPAPQPVLVTEAPVAGATAKAWFSVTLSEPKTVPMECLVTTRDGSAIGGVDYSFLINGRITFAAGETQKWVAITVMATAEAESREEFFLDVQELQTLTVKSAACTIERFVITGIAPDPVEAGVYRITFPAGAGQRCIIEESASLSGTWSAASSLLTGTGGPLEQKVYSSTPRGFFRLRAFSQVDPGTPAAGS